MADDAPDAVAALYAEHPYPAHGIISDVVATLLEAPLRRLQRELGRARLRLLDAGCGTGEQTLGIRRAFPELDVTGLDRNRASIDMAIRLAARASLPVRFECRDLLAPAPDLGTYDLLVSVGVVHYLEDPTVGFASLRRLANPGAALLGMVYGAYGKWETLLIRDTLRLICGEDAPRSELLDALSSSRLANNTGPFHYMETLVRRLRFGPRIPLVEAARRVLSGRSAAYQADTFTHAREGVYTYADVARMLDDGGWRFDGWPARSGMPDAPEQLFHGRARELVASKPLPERAAIYERIVRPMNLYFIATAK